MGGRAPPVHAERAARGPAGLIIVARTKFPVEVLTPEGEVFNEEVEMLSTHTALGSIGILANHEPVLALLEPTELRLYRSESEIVRFAQAEGYLQFAENRALLLVEEAVAPQELDRATLETRLRDARSSLEQAEEGSEREARARRDIRRSEAFLAVGQEARRRAHLGPGTAPLARARQRSTGAQPTAERLTAGIA